MKPYIAGHPPDGAGVMMEFREGDVISERSTAYRLLSQEVREELLEELV